MPFRSRPTQPPRNRVPTRAITAKPLNVRQQLFVSEYLKDFNGAAAYARAYGSRNPAACAAHAPDW